MSSERARPLCMGLVTPPVTPSTPRFDENAALSRGVPGGLNSDWTPPTSPQLSQICSAVVGLGLGTNDAIQPEDLKHTEHNSKSPVACVRHHEPPALLVCPFGIDFVKDDRGRMETLGTGAWSTVYKATKMIPQSRSFLLTPPTSPIAFRPQLVAVKVPNGKEAVQILRNESIALSHLASIINYETYCVPFHGLIASSTSIVMSAMSLCLESHLKDCARIARANMSTWTMSEPVIGSANVWLEFASQLITALAWLHTEADIVHGDVKPGNILLRSRHTMSPTSNTDSTTLPSPSISQYIPIFTDFSSSQVLSSPTPAPNTLSAITREYAAPELLSSKVFLNPLSTATPASDVFSLAVTLLVAATGNTMVYHLSCSVMQRQAMAIQGWNVIQHIRSGDAGVRIPRQGVVERVCEVAVLKSDMGRIGATKWKNMVEGMMVQPEKKVSVND